METIRAIVSRRTKRKFLKIEAEYEKLAELIEYARFAPTGANMQSLKYAIINNPELVKKVFCHTKWSGYEPERAPSEDEQPPAYIAMFGDKNIKPNGQFETEAGAAGTVILLAAEDMGLSACWLGAIDRKEILKLINVEESLELLYLIAVGYSVQEGKITDADGDIKYYTDENGFLCVPKRTKEEILINI